MFSVVIPAYNCEGTIGRALASVAAQTRPDLIEEIIVINDGSTDGTEQAVQDFIAEHPELAILYAAQENRGVSAARNRAIRMAKGEWIALLDSDDLWRPNKLERQAQEISSHPDMVFLGCAWPLRFLVTKRTRGLYKLSARQLCVRPTPSTPSVVFHRAHGLELGLFDEGMKYSEDVNFFQKFLLKDSYYILAEKLIEIDIGKKFSAQSGLSSNLLLMHRGRNRNVRELCAMGLISRPFMLLMLMFNELKFLRRVALTRWSQFWHVS